MSSTKKWKAVAPSNIALIKYMGKTDSSKNRPTNTSLSYTLPHLRSLVEIETSTADQDRWEPLRHFEGRDLPLLKLSDKGIARFLAHLSRLKDHYGYAGAFIVRSANDFPSDCGLASSASSFAALTMASLDALASLTGQKPPSATEAAEWSRQGSGSSCRSFFGPWSIWAESSARAVPELGHEGLLHQVIVVDEEVKGVSSSQAHSRVTSSLLFHGRPERAEERVRALMTALKQNEWREAFEISWAEFWDMHALFETSRPSFGYMTGGSVEALRVIRAKTWDLVGDGPIVTMDAGPNIHLLYRPETVHLANDVYVALKDRFKVISNVEGQR